MAEARYVCRRCGVEFKAIPGDEEPPDCPECESDETERLEDATFGRGPIGERFTGGGMAEARYVCRRCGVEFKAIPGDEEPPDCPECESDETERLEDATFGRRKPA